MYATYLITTFVFVLLTCFRPNVYANTSSKANSWNAMADLGWMQYLMPHTPHSLHDIDQYVYEGCSKILSSGKRHLRQKKILSPNFRELHVFLSRYMLAKILKKNVDVWYPQIVPGVWSLVTLHSAAAALKHLRSALRCWSLLTFIGQFWHNKSTV